MGGPTASYTGGESLKELPKAIIFKIQ